MRRRFPTQYSVALGEQADYTLRIDPSDPSTAITLLHEALDKLPIVQQQQYDQLAYPLRVRLALAYLLAGNLDAALKLLKEAFGERFEDAEFREHTMQRIVHDAARRDIGSDAIRRLHRLLCPQFPTFCGQFAAPVPETAPADASEP
jgi:hypothetical protein